MNRIPVVVCVDVEPDQFFIPHNEQRPWRGFECALESFQAVRASLSEQTPAKFTWVVRMDHQVAEVYGRPDWAIRRYADSIESIRRAGDDVGLHAHAYRWDAGARAWIVDHGNQAWVESCLRMSFDAFANAYGPCTTFRFGDRWMNHQTMQWLDRAGVQYDLTIEPDQPAMPSYHPGERFTGALPDYTGVPRTPYRPAMDDYRRPDLTRRPGLWVVPMTTASVPARWIRRLYYRMVRGWHHGVWTALLSHDPVLFRRVVSAALSDADTSHLALPVRSDVFAVPRLAARVHRNLDYLRQIARTARLDWTTAAGVVGR